MAKSNAGRPTDTLRVLRALFESDGLSNAYLRAELNLTDSRYEEIQKSLLDEKLIEKYRCRSGGVRLTKKGEQSVPVPEKGPPSSVKYEKDLYEPLIDFLKRQAQEDDVSSIPINTANLRTKGKWQNPDITQLTIEHYQYLRKKELVVTTYEVKQWGRWDTGVVFEAASHKRFSHEAIVVLEWPEGVEFSLSDPTYRLDEISRECQRFEVGLCTLRPYYSSYRLHSHIDSERHAPSDSAVESWLEYMFERLPTARKEYLESINSIEQKDGISDT